MYSISLSYIVNIYYFRTICNTEHVYQWQKELSKRLGLTGKVHLAHLVKSLCDNPGVFCHPSCVICVHHNYQK